MHLPSFIVCLIGTDCGPPPKVISKSESVHKMNYHNFLLSEGESRAVIFENIVSNGIQFIILLEKCSRSQIRSLDEKMREESIHTLMGSDSVTSCLEILELIFDRECGKFMHEFSALFNFITKRAMLAFLWLGELSPYCLTCRNEDDISGTEGFTSVTPVL